MTKELFLFVCLFFHKENESDIEEQVFYIAASSEPL